MYQSSFLTVEEVAENLKVTRQTVSKYIRSSELNAVKINKSYRITFDDFESFLNKNSTAAEPQVAYLRKTKNCFLEYSDKSDEFEILYGLESGQFKCIESNHNKDNNKFIFTQNM